jgi:hypothetical protein
MEILLMQGTAPASIHSAEHHVERVVIYLFKMMFRQHIYHGTRHGQVWMDVPVDQGQRDTECIVVAE